MDELQEDTSDLIDEDELKNQMQMEDGHLEMIDIHSGAKINKGFDVIQEKGEVEEVDYRTLLVEADSTCHDPGLDFQSFEFDEEKHARNGVHNGVGVHEVDVTVHGVGFNGGKVSQDNNVGEEDKEEVKVETCDQEIQTDLSLLDEMDEEELELMGFAHDEAM